MKAILETKRLTARLIKKSDYNEIVAMEADPEVKKYTGGVRTPNEAWAYMQKYMDYNRTHKNLGLWVVETKKDKQFIGFVSLKHLDDSEFIEVGYRFVKNAWGNGYATEITKAALDYGFKKVGLDKITAVVQPENKASDKVLKKLGLKYKRMDNFYNSSVKFYELENPYQ